LNLVLIFDDPRPKIMKVMDRTVFHKISKTKTKCRSQWPIFNSQHTFTSRWTW